MQHATIKHSDQLVESTSKFNFCTAGRVLMAMATFASKQGDSWACWPSKSTLAELAGVTPRTIQSTLKLLSELNLISVQNRIARSSIYRLNTALISKPTQIIMDALSGIGAMTDALSERVNQATSRLNSIREKFKTGGRSGGSPQGEKRKISTTTDRGDRADLPNNALKNNLNREKQCAVAPSSSKKGFVGKAASMSANAIRMCLVGAEVQINRLSGQLKEMSLTNAPTAERERIIAELEQAKANHREHLDMATNAGLIAETA